MMNSNAAVSCGIAFKRKGIYMIKKVFAAFATVFVIAIGCNAGVSADAVIGDLYRTDTFAYIDTESISVYSYNNIPYVVAEDLEGYGFDVKWKQAEQTLYLTYNKYKEYYPSDDVSYCITKTPVGYVYDSGVTVKLDGQTITSYSLDGRMLIGLDELWRYGKVNWYGESKSISVTTRNFMDKNPDWETLLPAWLMSERLYYCLKDIWDAYDVIDEFYYNEKISANDYFRKQINHTFDIADSCLNYIANDKYLYERGNLYHMAYNTKKYAEVYKEIEKYINGKSPKELYNGTWIYKLYDSSAEYYNEAMDRAEIMSGTIDRYIDTNIIPVEKYWSL